MGSNTSTPAGVDALGSSRRDASSLRPLTANRAVDSHDLADEFSDRILHKVTRVVLDPQPPPTQRQRLETTLNTSTLDTVNSNRQSASSVTTAATLKINFFGLDTYDTMEDQYNELDEGMVNPDPINDDVVRLLEPQDFDMSDVDEDRGKHIDEIDFTKVVSTRGGSVSKSPTTGGEPAADNDVDMGDASGLVPVEIKWVNTKKEPIHKIGVIGSFLQWHAIIELFPLRPLEYLNTLHLPLGVHKLLYIINNEYRVLELLPTATDLEGIFFNWFEVIGESLLFTHPMSMPDDLPYDANIVGASSPTPGVDATPPPIAGKLQVDAINRKLTSLLTKVSKETDQFEHIEYVEDEAMEQAPQEGTHLQVPSHPNSEPHSTGNSLVLLVAYHRSPPSYLSDIPEMFINYDYFKRQLPDFELPEPPQLPAHLNNVLLNKMNAANPSRDPSQLGAGPAVPGLTLKRPQLRRADLSYYASNNQNYHLSIPNHVILNHLMTTSIRNEVLTVACITRYLGKFITQIMHSPADTTSSNS